MSGTPSTMKRNGGKRDQCHENGDDDENDDDDSASNDSKQLQRRRRQRQREGDTDGSITTAIINGSSNAPRIYENDFTLSAPAKVQGTTHSIATLGESVHLPDYVREHNSTLTFPEKLMLTLTHVDRERSKSGIPESGESIGWVLDGTAFVVQNINQLCATWLPLFFGQSKFSSFTRKLYRWGFRKINVASIPNGSSFSDTALFFGNENFLRADMSQLSLMKSVTAAKTRSGVVGSLHRTMPGEHVESNVAESKPQAATFDINRNHQLQHPQPSAPVPSGEDMASLIQQSANLSTLLTLLSNNQQGGVAFTQPVQTPNPIVAVGVTNPSVPTQIPQAAPTDVNQMLQQLAYSAALLRSTGALQPNQTIIQAPQQVVLAPNMAWWMNGGNMQTAHQPSQVVLPQQQQPMLGWPLNGNRPVLNLQQLPPQNGAEQERLRGVMDTFVRYCETVQQQQQPQTQQQDTAQSVSQPPPDKNFQS